MVNETSAERRWWEALDKPQQDGAIAAWLAGDAKSLNAQLLPENQAKGRVPWVHVWLVGWGPNPRTAPMWTLSYDLNRFMNARYGETVLNRTLPDFAQPDDIDDLTA